MLTQEESRMNLLKQWADDKFLKLLERHAWVATITSDHVENNYIVITAQKEGVVRKIAYLYTSAIERLHLNQLAEEVDKIFVHDRSKFIQELGIVGVQFF